MELDHAKFSDLIGLIYDTAEAPELWPELLIQLDALMHTAKDLSLTDEPGAKIMPETVPYIPLLQPHFKRAGQISRRLSRLKAEHQAITAILDRLPIGVILVNAKQQPVAMNQQASKTLEVGDLLRIQNDKLVTYKVPETKQLSDSIKTCSTSSKLNKEDAQHTLLLTCKNGMPRPILVTPSVSNIHTEETLTAIFISNPNTQQSVSVKSLATAYKLTAAEMRLLHKLANGSHSLNEAAKELGVSKHTVRTQMKMILEKTGTHSQTELLKKTFASHVTWLNTEQPVALTHSGEETKLTAMQILRLHDGRHMEYAEYGDPSGWPVIFLHSLLHSRKQFHPYSRYAEKHGIRIIAPERPGFGYSDPKPDQLLKFYANDIRQLCEHLNLDKFDMVGDAAGAPFALACASTNTLSDKLRRTALISCIPDAEFDMSDKLIPFERMLLHIGRNTPASFYTHFATMMMKGMKHHPEKYYDRMYKNLSTADQSVVSTPEKRAIFKESIANCFPDLIEDFVKDYLLRLKRWDFSIEHINTEIDLWHGSENRITHIDSARKIATSLPRCQTYFLDGQGHYLFITHWDQILQQLTTNHP